MVTYERDRTMTRKYRKHKGNLRDSSGRAVTITVQLPAADYWIAQEIAKETDRSMSETCARLINTGLGIRPEKYKWKRA